MTECRSVTAALSVPVPLGRAAVTAEPVAIPILAAGHPSGVM